MDISQSWLTLAHRSGLWSILGRTRINVIVVFLLLYLQTNRMFSKYFAHGPIFVLGTLGSTSFTRSIGCLSHTTLQVLQLYYLAIFKVAFDIACSCLNIQLTPQLPCETRKRKYKQTPIAIAFWLEAARVIVIKVVTSKARLTFVKNDKNEKGRTNGHS